jgi:hypothetical protein
MLNTDPKRPLARIVAVLAGLAIFGWGLRAVLWQHDLHYQNWFGELVFAPLAILFGLLTIFGALFKPEILGRPRMPPKR